MLMLALSPPLLSGRTARGGIDEPFPKGSYYILAPVRRAPHRGRRRRWRWRPDVDCQEEEYGTGSTGAERSWMLMRRSAWATLGTACSHVCWHVPPMTRRSPPPKSYARERP